MYDTPSLWHMATKLISMAFNGRFILNIVHFAGSLGADVEDLIVLSGESRDTLIEESCKVEAPFYTAVIEAAIAQTSDPYFGLHAGEALNLAAAGLIAQITQTSETVRQALEYCCQFANLGCSSLPMTLVESSDSFQLILTPEALWAEQSPLALRHTAEGLIAFTIRAFHSLTREKHSPLGVSLAWNVPSPQNLTEYARVFACPLQYQQEHISIRLKKKQVNDKIITSDYELLRVLVAHAELKSAKLKEHEGFATQVKQSVVNLLKPNFPRVEQVASHLNMSTRTLQRRLRAEGHSFKQLIDELRKDFALSYLKHPQLSISEIAYLLDYGDASAFTRSFKRWTGMSPKDYRGEVLD